MLSVRWYINVHTEENNKEGNIKGIGGKKEIYSNIITSWAGKVGLVLRRLCGVIDHVILINHKTLLISENVKVFSLISAVNKLHYKVEANGVWMTGRRSSKYFAFGWEIWIINKKLLDFLKFCWVESHKNILVFCISHTYYRKYGNNI